MTVTRGNSMFRKNGVIAALVIGVLAVVFNIFFLDGIVKSTLIKSGTKMARARVEIAYLHVDLLKSKITVKGLSVADKSREFKNLFSADEAVIDYMLLPLLEKKYIIDNVSVINLAAGSERKTSGFLKADEVKKMDKEEADYKNSFIGRARSGLEKKAGGELKKMPVAKLAEIKDIKKVDFKNLVKKEDLASYKAIKTAQERVKEEKVKVEQAIKAADVDAAVRETKESVKKIREVKVASFEDIPAAKAALTELDKIKNTTEKTVKDVEKAKKQAEAFYEYSKAAYKEIDAAREKDYQAVLAKADINMLSADGIEKALIGDVWYDRVQKVMYYMSLAEKYIPKKKKKEKNSIYVKKRGTGREVVYSSQGRYPGFWIKKVVLSVKGADKGSSYYMKGEILDIAAEQDVTGKPLVAALQLDNPSQSIFIKAAVDHLDAINDILEISVKNLPASFIGLDKADFGSSKIEKAKVALEAIARNTDDYFMIKGSIGISDMQVSSADKQDIVYLAIKGIKDLKVSFTARQAASFSMEVTSNAYDQIKKSLASIYGSKIEKAKQDAKKAVEDAIKGELQGLKGADSGSGSVESQIKDLNSKNGQINTEIDKAKAELNKKITSAAGGNLLKGLIK